MTSARRRLTSLIVASCAAIAACGDPFGPGPSELEINRAKWREHGYRDYSVTMGQFCFCVDVGPFVVTVLGDSVVGAVHVSDGAPARGGTSLPTVNKLFDFIQKAIDDHAATIRVTYDAELGFPRTIVYDFATNLADEEVTYTLDSLKPLPNNLRSR